VSYQASDKSVSKSRQAQELKNQFVQLSYLLGSMNQFQMVYLQLNKLNETKIYLVEKWLVSFLQNLNYQSATRNPRQVLKELHISQQSHNATDVRGLCSFSHNV
tara:strand:+ start:954 stop:1265 length:312 start_codon:yes stop_codon:yes gene_type:complete